MTAESIGGAADADEQAHFAAFLAERFEHARRNAQDLRDDPASALSNIDDKAVRETAGLIIFACDAQAARAPMTDDMLGDIRRAIEVNALELYFGSVDAEFWATQALISSVTTDSDDYGQILTQMARCGNRARFAKERLDALEGATCSTM
jgi:hypothetical protein